MLDLSLTLEAGHERERLAFEDLLALHQRLVLRTAWRLLGSLEDAQDATQEVFLRLHRHLPALDQARGVESWLYRTTVNVCYDHLRARRPTAPLDGLPSEPATPPVQLASLELDERRLLLHTLLARLPEKERAAIVLREIEGLDTSAVAGLLGSSEVTVRSQVSSAKSKLRSWLSRQLA